MWVVFTGASAARKIALYTYRDSRSKTVAEELFGGYTGVVQTDGLQSYGSGDYENAGCWAHARRKFVDCIPDGDTACPSAQIVARIDKASEYERTAREKKYTAQQILEMRSDTVKPYVINRKNFLFSDTEKGADASAAVMSIIETAKRNNLDVYGYLLYLLTVLPEMGTHPTDDQIKSVMPWSFSLPAYCRQTYSEIQ